MPYCQTYLPTLCFSCFGLDPETPADDYQIHFVRAQDAAYVPPDAEAWPLFYAVALEAIKQFPGAFDATCVAVTKLCEKLRGHRALPPTYSATYSPIPPPSATAPGNRSPARHHQ